MALAISLLASNPLRASGPRSRGPARTSLVVLLVLGLVAPLAMTSPFGAWAQDPTDAGVAPEAGLPYWQVLRPEDAERWTSVHLQAVHFPTARVGYAAGGGSDEDGPYGVVLRTDDGGDNWKEMRLRAGDDIGVLRGVYFVSEDRGLAVGDKGVIVRTTDGGQTWRRAPSGVDVALNAVHFPSPLVGYAVGDPQADPIRFTILKTENGGASWRPQTADVEALANSSLRGVHFATPDMGVVVGFRGQPIAQQGRTLLRTTDGGAEWRRSHHGSLEPSHESVVLLEENGLGYAVGTPSQTGPNVSVRRSTNGFDDDTTAGFGGNQASAEHEHAASALYGVTAYWAEVWPVSSALDLLATVLVESPSEARELVAATLRDLADEVESLRTGEEGLEEVDEVTGQLADDLRDLAEAVEGADEVWEAAQELLRSLREENVEELHQALVGALESAAGEVDDLQTGDDDLQAADDVLAGLAQALRSLAEAVGELDTSADPDDARDHDQPVRLEVVHAVGSEAGLPVALTRPGGPQKTWALEPIEGWDELQDIVLRDVSASPGGRTVVAVGDDGLILRRTAAADEVVCVPQELAESLSEALDGQGPEIPEGVPVCRDESGERQDPEDKEAELTDPPTIELSPDTGRPGSAITVSGTRWLACREPEDPDSEPECEPSTVDLLFLQGGQQLEMGKAVADQDGGFTLSVTVPPGATTGSATIRAVGDPIPDGGREAEADFTVFAVTPVTITLNPVGARPEETFQVTGAGWHTCKGPGDCEGSLVRLELRQGSEVFRLDEVQAGPNGGFSNLTLTVPADAQPGNATIRAEGIPAPDGGRHAEAPFQVHTECGIPVSSTNPEFPCLMRFRLLDEEGKVAGEGSTAGVPNVMLFDPGLGESGRVVALRGSQVFLYDTSDKYVEVVSVSKDLGSARVRINEDVFDEAEPGDELTMGFSVLNVFRSKEGSGHDKLCVTLRLGQEPAFDVCEGERVQQGLKQRGVPGFGKHFKNESAHGDVTGVVNLDHADGVSVLVGSGAGRRVALDTENHRLFIAAPNELESTNTITALSLVGEFRPVSYSFPGRPLERVTHLAVDGGSSMVYAATTGGVGFAEQNFATTFPQREVAVKAFRARVVNVEGNPTLVLGADDVDTGVTSPNWSLQVGDLCSTTLHSQLGFFGVGNNGRYLSLPCQGTDFLFSGVVEVNPGGILTVVLPEDVPPETLTQADAAVGSTIIRRFNAVPGGGMGTHSVQRVQGDQAGGLLTWRSGDRFQVWDLDRAGWVARGIFRGTGGSRGADLAGVDPTFPRLYLQGGSEIPAGHLVLMEALNLPGRVERSGDPKGDLGMIPIGIPSSISQNAFDPSTRRLVATISGWVRVLEDRTPPPLPQFDPHPDRRTNDLDERTAFSVDRRGQTSAYGARVWSTGLRGSLPGTYLFTQGSWIPSLGLDPAPPPPGWTYEDLWGRTSPVGGQPGGTLSRYNLNRSPWKPHPGQREVFSARVEEGVLESGDLMGLTAGGESGAAAWGVDTDGREPSEGTGEDIRSRRGGRDWRGEVTAEMPSSMSETEEWEEHGSEFDRCSAELYDRLLRELDGQRRVEHRDEEGRPVEPCFGSFDQHDPHWNEEEGENERDGVEQRLGWTQRSHCTDSTKQREEASTIGSTVVCDLAGESTIAAADNALSTELPGGVTLDIDGSFSGTKIFRDNRGLVSQAVGVASGIELAVAGVGSLQIGEVLTQAESWANGLPNGAESVYSVAYKDVQVTAAGPEAVDGQPGQVVVFSCDPQEDQAVVAGSDLPEATCDPEALSDAVASVFGPRVTITVPTRDEDELATGTPGGAQAIVRRNLVDFYNDLIVLESARPELPGLQIEVNADGTLPNRHRIELAAVYAESTYFIGDLAPPATTPPAMVEAPLIDHRQTATVEVELVDPAGQPLEGGTFELVGEEGFSVGCTTDPAGGCVMTPLPLDEYTLWQREAPSGYVAAEPIGFAVTEPGQVVRITVVNGRGGTDGSEVIEIIEILEDARPAAATDEEGWWQRLLRGLPGVILNPWTVAALALITVMILAPAYLAARRRELSAMREAT